ncbi:ribonuclease E/G-like protein, chloroplastic [Chenopodium quinoa]|uniref:ribonuclease E/G-like protein, chloroplastic n=1 Tax=Chenopodium quinoa TaxID=63459 RepID=UPI000B78711D|nr:ribonuclease E/G-like protein, chloroplastic [Chenopodium quinoa]
MLDGLSPYFDGLTQMPGVALPNGESLVIEQTEALVSIDVNGGHGMFGQGASQEKAIVDVKLAAAKQIARELRLRDIGAVASSW